LNSKYGIPEMRKIKKENCKVKLPNIDFMMNMTKEFLDGKMDSVSYSLDFPYELQKRYKKMNQEDDDYCYLIYEDLYEDGVARFDELSETEFKKLIRKHYNYIKKIAKEGFY
jgi:hypothetical protein